MKALRTLLADRRRSQRGSVLSGVLIMVAFLAIISGALMTELSTNFLLSRDLVNRVQTQATVTSAAELALNQLQSSPINAGCPAPNAVSLNGQTAVATVTRCASVIDKRSPQRFTRIGSSNPFQVDGTHAVLPGLDDYVVGDSGGTVFDYTLGQSSPRWTLGLGGSVTGPPLVIADTSDTGAFIDLFPASGESCDPSTYCVAVVSDDGSSHSLQCSVASGLVTARPAPSKNFGNVAFFGDANGNVTAFNSACGAGGTCDPDGGTTCVPSGYSITQGPVVISCSSCRRATDQVFFVMAGGGGNSQLVHFPYNSQGFASNPPQPMPLPWANATGMAVEPGGSRIAITFQGGGVALVQVDTNGNPTLVASTTLAGGISAGPPFWCACPGPTNIIGLGGNTPGGTGYLYLFLPDSSLQLYARSPAGARILTTPIADGAGNWYVAPSDGRLYELQKAGGPTMAQAASYGLAGAFRSSPVVGPCHQDVCLYLASTDASAYLVDLDARDVVLTSCVSTASTCSGLNPRLWASVEIGIAGYPQVIHVQGWSYYSS